ncbi:MAG: hypothetical protein J6N72_11175 [Psychrobacter sp.]|nr:hypothetical protein [Psychrobacter sp.]
MSNTQNDVSKKRYTNRMTIERIYTSRGDNGYNHEGIKDDKFAGVMIEGEIFWIDDQFATVKELGNILSSFNIYMDYNGAWGNIDCRGYSKLDKRIVKVSRHHDDFFDEKAMYYKKAKFNKDGKIWWSVLEIHEHFDMAFNICNKDCDCVKKTAA